MHRITRPKRRSLHLVSPPRRHANRPPRRHQHRRSQGALRHRLPSRVPQHGSRPRPRQRRYYPDSYTSARRHVHRQAARTGFGGGKDRKPRRAGPAKLVELLPDRPGSIDIPRAAPVELVGQGRRLRTRGLRSPRSLRGNHRAGRDRGRCRRCVPRRGTARGHPRHGENHPDDVPHYHPVWLSTARSSSTLGWTTISMRRLRALFWSESLAATGSNSP